MNKTKEELTISDLRKLGMSLTKRYNAPQTQSVIQDKHSTMQQIFAIAADEVGVAKLAKVIVSDHPEWAFALNQSLDLGEHQPVVLGATQSPKLSADAIEQAMKNATESLTPVSHISLGLQGGVGGAFYCCYYTMVWQSAANVLQPFAAYPNHNDWLWTFVKVQNSSYRSCLDFAKHNPKSPLSAGDPVVMLVNIVSGKQNVYAGGTLQAFKFVFDPNARRTLAITGTGVPTDPIFKRSPYT